MNSTIGKMWNNAHNLKRDAHKIFSLHEASNSRVVILDKTYRKIRGLTSDQEEMLRQSLRCTENGLFKAAHIMAWASLVDYIERCIWDLGILNINQARPKWKIKSLEDLRENYPESQIIDAGRELGIYRKNFLKALQGLLNKRNECAHPSEYYPEINQTLGYISEIIDRLKSLMI